ncbi:hypothetical protein GQ43DRAFT_434772 [Delitschia confertaspora ATCC 74209]|uniref:Uncharacterized protein n=1 Tax=Delitschia confertaspora ATCC 74209 TaxID=1513339 RepID=A0A9P4JGJ5_9PLEO|nr:hypothetical protein GQ43DRAFT_434772 [Delitschia confertaspora ATCC 74209]
MSASKEDSKLQDASRNDLPSSTKSPPYARSEEQAFKLSLAADKSTGTHLAPLDFTPSLLEMPTPAECFAHLKLLHAFHKLRNEIANHEGLYGIHLYEAPAGPSSKPVLQDFETYLEKLREKRWTIYVTKAVDRFSKWLIKLPVTSDTFPGPIQTTDFDPKESSKTADNFPTKGRGIDIGDKLPPLERLTTMIFTYDPGEAAKASWKRTEIPWDSIDNSHSKEIRYCPNCDKKFELSWTEPPAEPMDEVRFDQFLEQDIGFASSSFRSACPSCNLNVTHETLRVGKFINDCTALLKQKRPMPGTILNMKGMPEMVQGKKNILSHDLFFPNRVVQNTSVCQLWSLKKDLRYKGLTILDIQKRFEDAIREEPERKLANASQFNPNFVSKDSRYAVRRMMANYWDNSSPFALDLVGAVMRQGVFIQKMVKIDWLRSPVVMTTMSRLIVKYHRFIRIIAEHPKKTAVPTLDVDLAWHTHQLSPKSYYSYSTRETKKFVNHDDKISEVDISAHFRWTSNTYEKKYGQLYSDCACWYCECVREPLRSAFTNKVNPFRAARVTKLEALTGSFPKDAFNGPHVSAHNAVKILTTASDQTSDAYWVLERKRENKLLDEQYTEVCKRYKRKKKHDETPSKENADVYLYSAYGYPIYTPVYVPYYAEISCDGDQYTSKTVVPGAYGGCAAGTCGGNASMGGCCDGGGGGGPECKASCGGYGNAAGGCGSSNSGGGDGGGDSGGDGGGGDGGGGGCGGCGGG